MIPALHVCWHSLLFLKFIFFLSQTLHFVKIVENNIELTSVNRAIQSALE